MEMSRNILLVKSNKKKTKKTSHSTDTKTRDVTDGFKEQYTVISSKYKKSDHFSNDITKKSVTRFFTRPS